MSYEMVGKLHKKFETQSKTASFQAREFVMESTDTNYTQYIKFQLTQDRCGLIDNYNEGDQLKVFFDLRGREWNEKYFTNLNAWKVEANALETQPEDFSNEPFPSNQQEISTESEARAEDFDDLPF